VSAKLDDKFDHARFASVAALVAAIALVAAVVVPSLPASIVLFGVVGFAFGPVYPLIMAVAGDRFPGRSAAVTGLLSGCAVIGAIVYPPVMGFLSVGVGLGAAMAGAAGLAAGAAVVLFLLGRAPAPLPVGE
jgi:MFS family permease